MPLDVDRELDLTAPDDSRLDALLRRAAGSLPEVDWKRFRNGVTAGIEAETRARSRRRLLYRLSVPLAAAAAVALYVGILSPQPPEPVFQVAYAPAVSIVPGIDGTEDLLPFGERGAAVRFEWPETATSRRAGPVPRRALLVVTYGEAPVAGS